jgi:predicted RND superfamily exporter protein
MSDCQIFCVLLFGLVQVQNLGFEEKGLDTQFPKLKPNTKAFDSLADAKETGTQTYILSVFDHQPVEKYSAILTSQKLR